MEDFLKYFDTVKEYYPSLRLNIYYSGATSAYNIEIYEITGGYFDRIYITRIIHSTDLVESCIKARKELEYYLYLKERRIRRNLINMGFALSPIIEDE